MALFSEEDYYGNIEYKLFFNIKNRCRLDKYITQLNFRINEGNGNAIYLIGVSDNGHVIGLNDIQLKHNIDIINYMSSKINSKVSLILNCTHKNNKFLMVKIVSNKHNSILF